MQRRLQTETMEGRLSSDLTPVEARLASDSLRLQRLPSPQGLQSAPPEEVDLKIWTGESGLCLVGPGQQVSQTQA